MQTNKMMTYEVRKASPEEYTAIEKMTWDVYQTFFPMPSLTVFPLKDAAKTGTKREVIEVFVAVSSENELLGSVIFIGDMSCYDYGDIAQTLKNCTGIQSLVVKPTARGFGVGSSLTKACIQHAAEKKSNGIILHITQAMKAAWKMYENLGFQRSPDLDYIEDGIYEYGFCLSLAEMCVGRPVFIYEKYEQRNAIL